ncbi:MAG: aromatic amino acid transport family protein [Patescibacteria group bacterium]|jgi:tyrosine-specific transport protein
MKLKANFFSAVAMLVGTVIGVGMFGIPYVISKVGFGVGFLYLLILGIMVTITTLAFGEIILRTKGHHQMTGYAKKYAGIWGQRTVAFSLIFGVFGATLAYTIGIGNFLAIVFKPYFGGTPFLYSLIFYILASIALLFGMRVIEKLENLMVFLLLLIVGFVIIIGVREISLTNFIGLGIGSLFLPYGVILFSYEGASTIPGMVDLLAKNKRRLKIAIIFGMIIAFLVYLFFSFVIVGISGDQTSEEAIVGVSKILGRKIVVAGAILGILAVATSFFSLGMTMKDMFQFDYKIKNIWAWVITVTIPLIIFVLGARSFIAVIEIVGTVTGGLQGIMILRMFLKAKKIGQLKPAYSLRLPKFLIYILYIIFGGGIVYQIFYNVVAKFN